MSLDMLWIIFSLAFIVGLGTIIGCELNAADTEKLGEW